MGGVYNHKVLACLSTKLYMVSSHGNPIATRPLPQSEIKADKKAFLFKGAWWLRTPLKNTLFPVGVAFTALVRIAMIKVEEGIFGH